MRIVVCVLLIMLVVGCNSDEAAPTQDEAAPTQIEERPVAEWFDNEGVLREMANYLPISSDEIDAINSRLLVLSTQTVPPVWGYAGMLLSLAKVDVIDDFDDINVIIAGWESDPALAEEQFRVWNEARLAE